MKRLDFRCQGAPNVASSNHLATMQQRELINVKDVSLSRHVSRANNLASFA